MNILNDQYLELALYTHSMFRLAFLYFYCPYACVVIFTNDPK